MKLLLIFLAPLALMISGSSFAQRTRAYSTGLPGDNFSLEGALEMFKRAESPEDFERLLNTEDNKVNNLDLNEDGEIDYIKVIDNSDQEAHAFVLQAVMSETESQDIAVIELERRGDHEAVLQIVGDEDIYGEQTILEPTEEVSVNAGTSTSIVVVNVWAWPAVRYVYTPSYRMWMSPWVWSVRPVWWRPWRPVRYRAFYHYRTPYRNHYVVAPAYRVEHAHRVYAPHRTTSVIVTTRHQSSVNHYRETKKQTFTAPRGNRQVGATRKTTIEQRKTGSGKVRPARATGKRKRD